jgi:serine/threonine protein kinase
LQAIAHRQLKHENIVPFLGVISFDNTLAIVMPWQENGNAINFLKAYNEFDKDKMTLDLVSVGPFCLT